MRIGKSYKDDCCPLVKLCVGSRLVDISVSILLRLKISNVLSLVINTHITDVLMLYIAKLDTALQKKLL